MSARSCLADVEKAKNNAHVLDKRTYTEMSRVTGRKNQQLVAICVVRHMKANESASKAKKNLNER